MASKLRAADILDRFYAAERNYMAESAEKRDFSGMAATLSPDMRLLQSPDLPYGGEYTGHAGFLTWSEAMAARFDKLDVVDPKVFEGGDEVIVKSTLKLRVRGTGEELARPLLQSVKVDLEKEVITEIVPFYWDVKGLNEALARAGL